MIVTEDSFLKRYFIKIASSLIAVAINAVIQLILPRALDIELYGIYSYNLNIFTSVVTIANLSVSDAFISKISKRRSEYGLIGFYAKFFFLMTIGLNLGIAAISRINLIQIFRSQTFFMIMLALNASVANKLLSDITGLFDAYALTRYPAVFNLVQKVLVCVLVFGTYIVGIFNLHLFYFFQISMIFLISILLGRLFYRNVVHTPGKVRLSSKKRGYGKEVYTFCRPLIVSTVFRNLVTIFSNFILMHYSGAGEQAFFGVAWQLSTLLGYVFSPYVELLKREFAVCIEYVEELEKLYRKSMKVLSLLVGYFTSFIVVYADIVLKVLFGATYSDAVGVTILIMFYTIFIAWGQVDGSLLVASERTVTQSFVSILSQMLTVILMFVFQIPNALFPDGLGSYGIAWNYLIAQSVSCLVSSVINCHYLRINYKRHMKRQIVIIIGCFIAALCSRFIIMHMTKGLSGFVVFLAGGFLYTAFIVGMIWCFPLLTGVKRESLMMIVHKIKDIFFKTN